MFSYLKQASLPGMFFLFLGGRVGVAGVVLRWVWLWSVYNGDQLWPASGLVASLFFLFALSCLLNLAYRLSCSLFSHFLYSIVKMLY